MSKRIEFDAPDGWSAPEGKTSGDDIETLATVRLKSDGRLCLVELDGHRMKGFKDDDEDDEPDGKSYADASSDAMDEQGGY